MLSLHTSIKFYLLCLPKTSKIHANDTSKCKLLYRRETLHRYHFFILFSLSSNCNCISQFADLESLPNILARHYTVLRNLDKSLQDIQRQNEQRCEQEIEDIKREIKSGNITPDTSLIRFSDEALDEQKHSIGIADEKVMLAVRAYDLVDTHIQQLDQYLKTFEEELRERDTVAASALPAPSVDTGAKPGRSSEGGRGGRKKTRLATATAATATTAVNPTAMDLDIPVDPNEPTYCLCNQVSYGEMVACENPNCKVEWFHFGCVGLKDKPKGKWYCPDCAALKNRRKGR